MKSLLSSPPSSSPQRARSPATKRRRPPTQKQFLQAHQMAVSMKYPFLTPQQIKRKTIELWMMVCHDLLVTQKSRSRARTPKSVPSRLSATRSPAMFSSPETAATGLNRDYRRIGLQPRALLQMDKTSAGSLNVFSLPITDEEMPCRPSDIEKSDHISEDVPQGASILKRDTHSSVRRPCYKRRVSFSPRSNPAAVDPLTFADENDTDPTATTGIMGGDGDDSDGERDFQLARLHGETQVAKMDDCAISPSPVDESGDNNDATPKLTNGGVASSLLPSPLDHNPEQIQKATKKIAIIPVRHGSRRRRPKKCESTQQQQKLRIATVAPSLVTRKSPRLNKTVVKTAVENNNGSDQNNGAASEFTCVPAEGVPDHFLAGSDICGSQKTPLSIVKFRRGDVGDDIHSEEDGVIACESDVTAYHLGTLGTSPDVGKDMCIIEEFDTFDQVTPSRTKHSLANRKRCLSSQQVKSMPNFHAMFSNNEDADDDFFC